MVFFEAFESLRDLEEVVSLREVDLVNFSLERTFRCVFDFIS